MKERERKKRGAIDHELDELNIANANHNFNQDQTKSRRNENIRLNTFDYDSDEESKLPKEKEQEFNTLLQSCDKILFGRLNTLLQHHPNVIQSLKNKRNTMKSTLVSDDVEQLVRNYRLPDKIVKKCRQHEIAILEMAKEVSTNAKFLKHTDIQKKLERAEKLQGKSAKRRLTDEDKDEESQEKAQKKHSKTNSPKSSHTQVLTSLGKGQLRKFEYVPILEQVRELLNSTDNKDSLEMHLEIQIAIKDASTYPLNHENLHINYGVRFGLVQHLQEDNLDHIQIMIDGPENERTASACARLTPVLQKYQKLLSTTTSMPAASTTTATSTSPTSTSVPTTTTSTSPTVTNATITANTSTTTSVSSTMTSTSVTTAPPPAVTTVTPLTPQTISLANPPPVAIDTQLYPFLQDQIEDDDREVLETLSRLHTYQ